LQLPGADGGKPDLKGAADKAVKKTPFGVISVGDLAFDLPGSGVSKDDLPNNVKPGDAKGLPKGPSAKPPSAPSLPKVNVPMFIVSHVMPCQLVLSRLKLQLQAIKSQAIKLHFQVLHCEGLDPTCSVDVVAAAVL